MNFQQLKESLLQLVQECQLKRVLLAYSGGPDSQSLLHTLIDLRNALDIGVAHVDHGWREESEKEASELKIYVESFDLPFYLKRLDSKEFTGNLEKYCREERLKFFSELCKTHQYDAVFFGHHKDDLAETVLKRILEGSSFLGLPGMKKSTQIGTMLVARPFLDISKQMLLDFLKSKNISFIEDRTNNDSRFLRSKMRATLLPELNKQFGKVVNEPLARFSKECLELNEFMYNRFALLLAQENDLDCRAVESHFELRWLIRAWLKKRKLAPSYSVLEDMVHLIAEKKWNRKFLLQNHEIAVNRGRLFLTQGSTI